MLRCPDMTLLQQLVALDREPVRGHDESPGSLAPVDASRAYEALMVVRKGLTPRDGLLEPLGRCSTLSNKSNYSKS